MMPNRDPLQDVAEELRDPEYRRLYGAADAKAALALLRAAIAREEGLSSHQMMLYLGVTPRYYQRMLAGEANPTLSRLGEMLAYLGLRLVLSVEPLVPRGEK